LNLSQGLLAPTDRADDGQLVVPLQKIGCKAPESFVVVHKQDADLKAVFQVYPIRQRKANRPVRLRRKNALRLDPDGGPDASLWSA
jgi:hypothetical protein